MAREVELTYEPRPQFVSFHQRKSRFAALVCHRRAGKTVACVNELIIRALFTKKSNCKYAYVGPFRQQAKEIAWEYLKNSSDHIRKGPPRESDLRITLFNGATITIYGADNPDALRGLYFDGIILDEYGDCKPTLWGEIILPTLLDRKGWAVFIGTMKGKNHFYKTLERAKSEPSWFHMELKASESGILDADDLREARAEMTDAQYRQEMECDANAAIQGSYYSELLAKMEDQRQIGSFKYNPHEMVHVSADLGFSDSTAFWFWQLDEDGPILIDYEEADSKPLDYYFELLNGKPYEYADIWLPHDAKARSFQTGRSTIEQFINQGFPCKAVPRLAVQHGIDAARLVLPACRIDHENCQVGIEALRAYRRQFNEKTQQYSNTPLHDWASNGADAFRYFSLVTDDELAKEKSLKSVTMPILESPKYTLDELFKDRDDSWRNKIIRL